MAAVIVTPPFEPTISEANCSALPFQTVTDPPRSCTLSASAIACSVMLPGVSVSTCASPLTVTSTVSLVAAMMSMLAGVATAPPVTLARVASKVISSASAATVTMTPEPGATENGGNPPSTNAGCAAVPPPTSAIEPTGASSSRRQVARTARSVTETTPLPTAPGIRASMST
ncbi:MAG: hypothetical protein R3F65_18050 [bacterium]